MTTDNQINLDEVEFLQLGEPPEDPITPIEEKEEEVIEIDEVDLGEEQIEETEEDEEDEEEDSTDDSDDSDESLYKSLIDSSGVKFTEEELADILSADENEEGFSKVAQKVADKLAETKLEKLLAKYPMTSNLMKFEMNGGDPNEYFETHFPAIDYNSVEIGQDDTELQKDVIKENLKEQGFSQEDIDEQVQDYESGGLLYKQSVRSLKLLQNNQSQKQADFDKRQVEIEQERTKAIEDQRKEVNSLITKGDLKGINIPEGKKSEFEEYLFKPVNKEGHSQAAIDNAKLTMEDRILITYLQYNGMSLDNLLSKTSKTKAVRNFRESLKGGDKIKGKKGSTGSKYSKNPNIDDLDVVL